MRLLFSPSTPPPSALQPTTESASPFLPNCSVFMVHQTKYLFNSNFENSSSKGLSSPNNHSSINSLPYANEYALRNPFSDVTPSLIGIEACDVRLDTANPREILKNIKIVNPNRLIIGQQARQFKGSHYGKY